MTRDRPDPHRRSDPAGTPARVDIPYPRLSPGLRSYFATEGAATLLLAAWANVAGDSYHDLWGTPVNLMVGTWELNLSPHHWVNDFLMAVFFVVVGVEVNRELTVGELRSFRAASVPLFGAIGGLAVPIGLYLLLNPSGLDAAGWGLPMSTDTAFVIGVLALVGPLRHAMVHPGTYRTAGPESFGPGSMPTRPCRVRYASQPKARGAVACLRRA